MFRVMKLITFKKKSHEINYRNKYFVMCEAVANQKIGGQGLGETFGRVTIEAMAFGLPV